MKFIAVFFVLFFSAVIAQDSYTPGPYGYQWATPGSNGQWATPGWPAPGSNGQWATPGWNPYYTGGPYYGYYATSGYGGPYDFASSPSPFKK
ncbi:hypothetical protein QR680_015468 [Steinernema hermaphroditum]|uniref:Uncharacterized protein n=1 Tax=Steinernema hermaphroditum TaxID=289476 RepID=A0AA39LKM4_9BILA|nr:hypothetical protein QR680_015468 [Steinernema hermaphroditum]